MGELFGRYELIRRIGAGGMAEVFVAKNFGAEGFEKRLVIKRILPAFNEDPDFVRMFINEARIAAKLQHANIVQVFDFNHVNGIYYIAMEWVDGLDLRRIFNASRRRQMPIPIRMAIHIGLETLKGLHYANTKIDDGKPLGLVHRDISPHNLLVSFAGEAKITDFGIAKIAALTTITRSGVIKGKLPYMSPEQVNNKPVDVRSDLFSLGVVLWELLSGQRLYQASSEAELFAQVKKAEIPDLHHFNPEVSTHLKTMVGKLLAEQPGNRYQTALEAMSELRHLAQVDDALCVSEYIHQLLPVESSREQKGDTQALPGGGTKIGGYSIGTANESTHTLLDEKDREPEWPPLSKLAVSEFANVSNKDSNYPGSKRDKVVETQQSAVTIKRPLIREKREVFEDDSKLALVSHLESEISSSQRDRNLSKFWKLVLPIGACCFFIFFGTGWWVSNWVSNMFTLNIAQKLTIQSEPSEAKLWIEGIEVGSSPLSLRTLPGTNLHLKAKKSLLVAESRVPLNNSNDRIFLKLIPEKTARNKSEKQQATAQKWAVNNNGSTPSKIHQGVNHKTIASVPEQEKASSAILKQSRLAKRGEKKPVRTTSIKGWGTIDIIVSPWARVKVDGKDWGQTPHRGRHLASGNHNVELQNSELRKFEKIKIKISSGKLVSVRRNWEALD